MMDGRIKVIRENLETKGYHDTLILSYSSKFCSNFYSPFRDILGSKKNLGQSKNILTKLILEIEEKQLKNP